ncbi:hypothetical protein P691DRAFT_765356 [Macrolepiota fuliginosa MF-IS2]|uniref:RING-type domain-containing protein n=1 Tax=Macrolepiota fuliginosa MF-IS2 TaxID=1400762 RepID=A0A9P5X2N4_9AGAR|nr:hypothetical protein P691DRAFT_765356 [Macrolepiota fuliginosa MF-IS2]
MPRPQPTLPPLTISQKDLVERWLDRLYDTDSIDEHLEYSLNLGAESPASTLLIDDEVSSLPLRIIKCKSVTKARCTRDTIDRDCGICFEDAVHPSRTLCCGGIFCSEHITDWLHGPSSDGRCPSCSAPCFTPNILSLAPPTLIPKPTTRRCTTTATFTARDSVTTTISSEHSSPLTARGRSVSTSTFKQCHTSTDSFASSTDSSILGLSLAPEDVPKDEKGHGQCWLVHGLGASPAPTRSHPSFSLAVLPATVRTPSQSAPPYPPTHPGSLTVEVLSRLASVMGLTLLFYILLAS